MNLVKDLRKDLGAKSLEESEIFYGSKYKIVTPLPIFNTFLGGGLPSATIVEVAGEPKAGKSTFVYSSAGTFHMNLPTSIVYIIDSEKSAESVRMKSFGMDPDRTIIQPSPYLEHSFACIHKFIDKLRSVRDKENEQYEADLERWRKRIKKLKEVKTPDLKKIEEVGKLGPVQPEITPALIIWDTIANTPTKAQLEDPTRLNPGGMNEKPRLIKALMGSVSSKLEESGVSLWIINQVYTHFGKYNTYTDSGGGFGLKHGCHYKIMAEIGKKEFSDPGGDAEKEGYLSTNQLSFITIKKTKSTPEIKQIPFIINTLEGGRVESALSTLHFFKHHEIIVPGGGWYSLPHIEKSFRYVELEELALKNDSLLRYLLSLFIYDMSKRSSYLRRIQFNDYVDDSVIEDYLAKNIKDFEESLAPSIPQVEEKKEPDNKNEGEKK